MTTRAQEADAVSAKLADIAIEAGVLLRQLQGATRTHIVKADGTPTTAADRAAEDLILARLAVAWPEIAVVAEESAGSAATASAFFLVDPLDGTRDFLAGSGEYSVNIALVEKERPVAAAIAAPALGRVWRAGAAALTSEIVAASPAAWRPIATRPRPEAGLVALVSRRHGDAATDALLASLPIAERRTASSAVKFCLIAEGAADLYLRCGPTMEWDTAAGDHIVSCAGGCVIGPGGAALRYGQSERGFRNGPFAAVGDPRLASRLKLPAMSD